MDIQARLDAARQASNAEFLVIPVAAMTISFYAGANHFSPDTTELRAMITRAELELVSDDVPYNSVRAAVPAVSSLT